MLNLAIFASGSGTNAEAIIRHFSAAPASEVARVALVITNKPGAGVIARAAAVGTPMALIPRDGYSAEPERLVALLKSFHIDLIALAGYLRQVPEAVIAAYPRRILNLHPALLPRYGGKGMFGAHVHSAVLAAGEAESGITIHLVEPDYDTGPAVKQVKLAIHPSWTAETLATEIHKLEHLHYPGEIEALARRILLHEV